MESILDLDTWLLLTINGFNNEYVDPMMKMFSSKNIWIILYVAIAGVICWKYGWRRALLIVAATGIAVGASDFICASVIRPFVQRMRPTNPENEINVMVHIVDGYRSGKYGFPSCHAANTLALALFTSLVLKSRGYTIFIFLWAFMQCYSRMYLGVHYPGDILVGGTIGCLIAYGIYCLLGRVVDLSYELNKKAKTMPAVVVGIVLCLFIVIFCLVK